MGQKMGNFTFEGYVRRLDQFDYRTRRHDVPHDVVELLELSRDIELSDKIVVDVEQLRE
jgi:hypothetical protein